MRRYLTVCVATCLLAAAPLFSQSSNFIEKAKYFLQTEQMPDASKFLPDYPAFGSELFLGDSIVYEAGKRLRDTARGSVAVEDASTSIRHILKRFSPAMGVEMTPETFPKLASLVYRSNATARLSITYAKDYYHRMRPYQYFNEPTPIPEEEAKDDLTSYPSGHTIRFWTAALVLAALDPDHQEEILKTGYECGQSRTIVGYHYQSDVDAARLAASAAYARMSVDPGWRKAFRKARKEFRRKTGASL
ncbi:MAG: phosphatase PAP2 family protein [Bacteroidales bacterium]|nr:phosphatase PAP2 family protein [Bacteroidales bacterium]